MDKISEQDILRVAVTIRTPLLVERLPFLSRIHKAAFQMRRRMSKRFVGKPAKRLFRMLIALGMRGEGFFSLRLTNAKQYIAFNARNTQFGALYLPQNQPLYEPETSALLDLLVSDDAVFFDIGANWGWYSILIASRPGYAGCIHAFEPFPDTFQDLSAVVRQAGMEAVIQCHDVALANRDGYSTMAFSDGVQSGLARLGEKGGAKVTMARLDSLQLPKPDVVKIDAEDHELEVLQGALRMVEVHRPIIVFENWLHQDRPTLTLDPINLLDARRYRFFYAGWVGTSPECITEKLHLSAEGSGVLALVPFLPAHRFQLPSQLNIVAVPKERVDTLKARFA